MIKNQSGFAHIGLLVIVVLVTSVIGFAGFRLVKSSSNNTVRHKDRGLNGIIRTYLAYKGLMNYVLIFTR
ncbi:hypothetical protein BH23PAT1_BH23PAT1_0160 [soil metagenome]